MDAKAMLEDLLNSSKLAAEKGVTLAEEKLGVPEAGEERDAMLSGMTKGALAAGAVALLLGTNGGRRLTGTALKLGGLAAVGGLAYKAYNEWQDKQNGGIAHSGTPFGELDDAASAQRSLLMLQAMLSAAKADGHLDAAEQANIEAQIDQLGLDQETLDFLRQQMHESMDPGQLAAAVESAEEGAELYLSSAMVLNIDGPVERVYLDRLAGALNLAPGLAQMLEQQLEQQRT
ncbi:MAG: tellurite resistance TerB family protein [Gammaproteobacteria bacterium]|nr:tellurite resistance TerB family protein [Gammaproteobacteria bacterium]